MAVTLPARAIEGWTNWTVMASTPADNLWRLTKLEGRLWATGNGNAPLYNGRVDRSRFAYYREEGDGTWTRISGTNSPAPIRAVETGLGAVAVGSSGRIWTKFAGETWQNLSVGAAINLVDVLDFQGLLVAVGTERSIRGYIATSTNGTTWTPRLTGVTGEFRALAQGGGRLVAVGKELIRVSEDGINWRTSWFGLPGEYDGAAFGNGRFVIIEGGSLYRSVDAQTWYGNGTAGGGYQAVTFAYGGFVAVNASGAVMGSVNGETWIKLAQVGSGPLYEAIAMDGRFVVAGGGGLMARSEIIPPSAPLWVTQPRGWEGRARSKVVLEGEATQESPTTYQWFRDGTPLVGQTGTMLTFESIQTGDAGTYWLVVSNAVGRSRTPDCVVRVAAETPSDSWQVLRRMDQDIRLDRCVRGPGRFVATTAEGALAESADGVRWNLISTLAPGRVRDVRFGSEWYVAVGEQGFLSRSRDGRTWIRGDVPGATTLNSAVFRQGSGWLAVGDNGEIWHSSDARSWGRMVSGVSTRLNAVVAGVSEFIAVGDEGVILTSPDGQRWTQRNSFTTETLSRVASGGGIDVAVGTGGTVVASAGGDWTLVSDLRLGIRDVLDVNFFGGWWNVVGRGWATSWRFRENRLPLSVLTQPDVTLTSPERLTSRTSDATTEYAVAGNLVLRAGTFFWATGPNREIASLMDIGDVAGRLVAVGEGGAILHSSNGNEWEIVPAPGTTSTLAAVAGDSSRGVAVGAAGAMLVSTDGSQWRSLPRVTTNHLYSVAQGGGRFVASGAAGTVLVSEDGQDWKRVGPLTWWILWELVYHEGRFWTASMGNVFQSTNGLDWVTNRVAGGLEITDLTFQEGSLVVLDAFLPRRVDDAWRAEPLPAMDSSVVMRNLDSDGGTLIGAGMSTALRFSQNRVDWFTRSLGQPVEIFRTRFLRGSVYAVGNSGTIARSAPWSRLSASPTEIGVVRLHPSDGRRFRLEHSVSPNGAAGWQTFDGEPVSDSDGNLTWRDDRPAGEGTRFYRAVLQE